MSSLPRLGKLVSSRTALFVCDMQEKFRSSISHFNAITNVCGRLIAASKMLKVPVVVTEMYPKGKCVISYVWLQQFTPIGEQSIFEHVWISYLFNDTNQRLNIYGYYFVFHIASRPHTLFLSMFLLCPCEIACVYPRNTFRYYGLLTRWASII